MAKKRNEKFDEFFKDKVDCNRLEFNEYTPEKWKEELRTDNQHHFERSVNLLADREKLDPLEAAAKLLDIMVKVTFIEHKLAVYGRSTANDLFEFQRKQTPNTLFQSADEIESFCESMSPVFFKDKVSKKYRNTGIPYRKMCQHLRVLIELGDVVDENTVDDIIDNFQEEVVVKYKELEKFQKDELFLDFQSLDSLGKHIPGFRFEDNEERLYLHDDAANRLPLYLPIFVNLIGYNHKMRRDCSRIIRCYVRFTSVAEKGVCMGTTFGHSVMSGYTARFDRRTKDDPSSKTFGCSQVFAEGYLIINDLKCHIEIFRVHPSTFSMHNNYIAHKTAKLDSDEEKFIWFQIEDRQPKSENVFYSCFKYLEQNQVERKDKNNVEEGNE